ncbi:hypothetical protein IQ37_17400 [Chryseobacterium piperi]|uniref:Uncharacterized protein n=1 Tax=Chryseobacterium piperi TaxID=558152 RepID=A0A086AK47_9FLAO|nr:hypothetical protein [Chryseobacterium piperi]ASW74843.1 hypothetical protein CJF12_11505 [Chryseobacterium piperi]KFF17061.1 hypothetical protein IQ37_17400 [Chryseobacterium piperi]
METKPTFEGDIETLNSPGTMTHAFIKELINNYRNNQLQTINKNLEMDDAHSIWFDLPKLKKFIADMEAEAKKNNPSVTEKDMGIRFYYAAYPKAENWDMMKNHPIPKEYAEKHTLVMVPTLKKEDGNGKLLDFDFNVLTCNGKPLAVALKSTSAIPPVEDGGLAQNHGNLIPPDGTVSESY